MMQRDMGHIHDETPGVGPGLGGHRDSLGPSAKRVITVSPPQGHASRLGRAGPCPSLSA